jgi:precorrin-6Y C5,15-methyltransferase (decarboxylating)
MSVWSQLGGPRESRLSATASTWRGDVDDLNVIALECRGTGLPLGAGLADDLFENDGQITKREVRAVVLSLLACRPGQVLWDVGAGTGSVGIEWMRLGGRAVAVERSAEKGARIERNAAALGVPGLQVVVGDAPDALAALPTPDAVFLGGGATAPGLLEKCWSALPASGRMVVNAVTLESEAALLAAQAKQGGELIRLSVQRTAPVGSFTGWKPMTTLTIWSATK